MNEWNGLLEDWRRSLRSQQYLEDGIIAELEDHLLNEIDRLKAQGHDEVEAFEMAKRSLGGVEDIANDEQASLRRVEPNHMALLRSILKVGSRYFKRNSLTSAINLGGLVAAFVAIMFISFFIHDELSYEQHHPGVERIHRLSYSMQMENGTIEDRAFSSGMWVDVLKDRSAEIDDTFRFLTISYAYLQKPTTNESFYTEGIYWADPNFFDFLKFEMKYGRKEDQLKDLNSITLTEKSALRLFGDQNPVGESLKFIRRGNEVNLVVTGVMYDPPSNSQFQPEYVAHLQAIQSIYGEQNRGWIDRNPRPGYVYSYVRLKEGAHPEQVAQALGAIWEESLGDLAERMNPLLTPIRTIHYNTPMRWELDIPIDMSVIYGLVIVGIFILVIVLTNFTNLLTAQASKRQKEIGLRKTLGSTKQQIMLQFFLESVGMVVVALLAAAILVYALTPQFNQLLDKNIDFMTVFKSVDYLMIALPLIGFVLFFAGGLPAIYFTKRIKPSFNINQFFRQDRVHSTGRNLLVVVQFTVAIILVISTITVYNQLSLINNGSLAKNREVVLGVRTSRMGDAQQAQLMKRKLESIAGVESNSLGEHLPRQSDFGRINTKFLTSDGTSLFWNKFEVDGGFVGTYGLELLAGRDFNRNLESDALIVNETAVHRLGLTPETALGTYLREDSINYVYRSAGGVIVGVVSDFVYASVKEEVEPLVICAVNEVEGVLSIKLGKGNKALIIEEIKSAWDEVYPNRPFEYWFLDKEFERMYSQERRLGRLIPFFSILAITIAMLGLLALTIFISEMRKKEIGIRKVLGCSSRGILRLLGWQFLRTLIPAILIGVPVAYLGLSNWLESFTYRVQVGSSTVILSVMAVGLFAALTISFKVMQAARRNPVDNLKYE